MVLVMYAKGKGDDKADHVWLRHYITLVEATRAIADNTVSGKHWVRGQVIDFNTDIDTFFDI